MPSPACRETMSYMEGQHLRCPVCTGAPSVAVAVAHRGLRTLIVELLQRDHRCWRVHAVSGAPELACGDGVDQPDLVIVDSAGFPLQSSFQAQRVVVIGPEPDPAYERAARKGGAGAWLASDRVGEDLSACARAVLGCAHGPIQYPPTETPPVWVSPTTVPPGEIFNEPARQPH